MNQLVGSRQHSELLFRFLIFSFLTFCYALLCFLVFCRTSPTRLGYSGQFSEVFKVILGHMDAQAAGGPRLTSRTAWDVFVSAGLSYTSRELFFQHFKNIEHQVGRNLVARGGGRTRRIAWGGLAGQTSLGQFSVNLSEHFSWKDL